MATETKASDATLIRSYGAKARREGKTHLENPWPLDTKQYTWWFEGWAGRYGKGAKT